MARFITSEVEIFSRAAGGLASARNAVAESVKSATVVTLTRTDAVCFLSHRIGRAAPDEFLDFRLSEQNIKLYRSYVLHDGARCVLRHRGKSPRQAAFFFRNPEVTFHASQLASLFLIYGLVSAAGGGLESRYRVGSLESGTLICQAYEAYLALHSPVSISFEHAWFLLLALARRDEVGIGRCEACGGVRLRDLLAKRRLACANCDAAGVLGLGAQMSKHRPERVNLETVPDFR